MKHLVLFIVTALLLSACAGGEPELSVDPTATAEEVSKLSPAASIIASTLTAKPTDTAPAEGKATETPISSIANPTRANPSPSEPATEDAPIPQGPPDIIFKQEGGYAGLMNSWEIYADGAIVKNGESACFADASWVQSILSSSLEGGFIDAAYTSPKNICCDFYTYTITITQDGKTNTIVVSDGDSSMPPEIRELITQLLDLVNSC
ncbi:MAG: hypothetical protein ACK2T3_00310 [Candidatus Promineifilaceae bacterium]|jgi:hypothetical protein